MMSNVLREQKMEITLLTFEESFLRLQENINLNHFNSNVVINNVAVSDRSGISTLKIHQDALFKSFEY